MRALPSPERYAHLPWLIVTMTVVALVIGTIAARYVESRLVASRGESLALAAAEIAHKLDLLLAERYDDVLELSRTQVFRKGGIEAQSDYLITIKRIHPIYLWLGMTDAQGRIVAATNPASVGHDRSRSSWFQVARDTGAVHVSDVEPFEEAGGIDAISFTVPIKRPGGEFQGTVTTRMGLPLLEEVVARTLRTFQGREGLGGTLEYKFMTAAGDVFIDSDLIHKGNVNLKRLGVPSALLSESGRPGYVEEEHLQRHVRVITGYARTQGSGEFPSPEWTVLLRTDEDNLVAPIRLMLWKMAGAWVLVWLPMLGFLLWSTGRLKQEWTHAQVEHAHALTAESNYRQLVEQARDIIYRTDAQGRFTFLNPTASRIMGYSEQEMLGRRFVEFIRPDARKAAERFYGRQFVRKTPSTYYEFPAVTKDGKEIWFGQNVQLLLEHGRPVGVHAMARDITERKRAEEALCESEAFKNRILESSPDCIKVLDLEGRLLFMNRGGQERLEIHEIAPFLNRQWIEFWKGEDKEKARTAIEAARIGNAGRFIGFCPTTTGKPKWWDVFIAPLFDADGKPERLLSISRDITDRKRAEDELLLSHEIIANAHDPISIMDLQGRFTYQNPAHASLVGFSNDELLGKTPALFLGDEAFASICRELARAQSYRGEVIARTKDGTRKDLDLSVFTIRDAAEKPTCFVAIKRDITERKQAEKALRMQARVLDSMLEGVSLSDENGVICHTNPAEDAMFGYKQGELIGKHVAVLNAYPPDENARIVEGVIEQLKAKGSWAGEFNNRKKDGTSFTTFARITALDLEGRKYWVCVQEDITDRKRAEEVREQLVAELAESRNRFEMFFRQTPSAISITTVKEGRFLDVNKQAEILTGYSREELLGRTTLEMNLYVDPTDRAGIVQRLSETGLLTDVERQIRTKSGEIRTAVFSLVLTQMGSEPCLLSIAHDITARKQAEEKLRERSRQQAVEAELSLLAVTASDLPNLLSTAAELMLNALEVDYCEVLELLPNGADLRLCASAGWRGDHLGQVKKVEPGSLAQAALQSTQPVIIQDLRTDAQSSGPRWLIEQGVVSGMGVAIHGQEDLWGVLDVYAAGTRSFSRDDINFVQTISGILATAIERAHAEDVLRNANQALRTLSRQLLRVQEDDRRAIARDLHDEIGQSLTAIRLNVERAQRASEPAARTRIMQDCAQIVERVLNQVRNLSLDLHPSILDDLGLVYALKWYAERQSERAGLKIEVAADPSRPRLPRDIEIGCFRIAQEALTNVMRHAKAGRASVTLKRGSGTVELRVRDDGIGFVVGAAFAPSGEASVGLASMQERARLLGGEVRITSAPGQGTEVIALLPLPLASPVGVPIKKASRS